MSQSFSTISSVRPNTGEWSFLPRWMNCSRKHVWKSASALRSRFLRLGQTETMCISSCNQCQCFLRKESCKSSKASRPEKSSEPVQRSRNNCGAESSGAMAISSAQWVSMATKRQSRSTSKIKVQNTSNCTRNNSTYFDTSQLAAAYFIELLYCVLG